MVYVAVFHLEAEQNEKNQWQAASHETLAKAYGEDEPDYRAVMVKESNADYKA